MSAALQRWVQRVKGETEAQPCGARERLTQSSHVKVLFVDVSCVEITTPPPMVAPIAKSVHSAILHRDVPARSEKFVVPYKITQTKNQKNVKILPTSRRIVPHSLSTGLISNGKR